MSEYKDEFNIETNIESDCNDDEFIFRACRVRVSKEDGSILILLPDKSGVSVMIGIEQDGVLRVSAGTMDKRCGDNVDNDYSAASERVINLLNKDGSVHADLIGV